MTAGGFASPSWWRFYKRLARRLREGPEWLLVALGLLTIPHLPRRAVLRLAHALGTLLARCGREQRRIVEANLNLVFGPTADRAGRRATVDAICRHAALVLMDFFWFAHDSRARVARYVTSGPGIAAITHGTAPAIVVTGHLGAWELAAQHLSVVGRPLTSVYAPLGGSLTRERLRRMRAANGQVVVPRRGAMVALLRALRNGEVVGLLLDQHTVRSEGGVFVDFLGRSAAVSRVAGTLSIRCRTTVFVVACRHLGDGTYRIELVDTLPPGHGRDELGVTQWVADRLGAAIRHTPTQWFWMYRRWKFVPPGEDAARYPFYARPFNPVCD